MARNAVSSVDALLKREGPCLSSRLCELLEADGLSPQAARQRVSRAATPVRRLNGLAFPRGVRFLYLESTYNSVRYWEALLRDLEAAGPAYAAAMAGLRSRGGIIPAVHFPIVSGSPVKQKKQISAEAV